MVEQGFQILKFDLSSGNNQTLHVEQEILRRFIGGASLAAYLLYPFLSQDLDPLSPEAPLLFLAGPLTGTKGLAVGRFVIAGKSPATQLWAESNIGGHFGPEMRATGYDGLWIEGRSSEPIYLLVHEGLAEMRSASHLWGSCDTYETQKKIQEELGDPLIRVACIGAAGENQLPFALVLCDHGRVAGRTGMGAVMGAKGLKAVAVRGHQVLPLYAPDKFSIVRGEANRALRNDNVTRTLRQLGTSAAGDYFDYLGEMPKRYFTRGVFGGTDKVSGVTMTETILTSVSTCHGCVIACGRVVTLSDGKKRKGPEYETIVGFGPLLEIDDLGAITMLGEHCDRYGMDTISMANIIGLAFLLFEQGVITEKTTGGEKLEWGSAVAAERLVHLTANREGFGELLALGAKALAKNFDVEEMAAHVKGLEVPFHDPRGASGMGLVYATSPRGACHNQSDYFMVEIGQTIEEISVDLYSRQAGAEKAFNVARHQDWRTIYNSLILCLYVNVAFQTVVDLLNLATGFDYSMEDLLAIGERGWNLKRILNHRLGLTREDDRLPKILLKPFPDGGSAGYVPPIDEMLKAYYQVRGWDSDTGRPSEERLRRLQLEEYLPDLLDE
ncbi:MAG: aldehyde ferredoxin oxidoreductase [Anaerolineales bacterium]|nr:aldehyde ferredoxin oxidoreductase [Anaerolineales bacterium]